MSAQVIKLGDGCFFLKITNFLNNSELSQIWEEISFLSYRSKLSFDLQSMGRDDSGLKSNKISVWLDDIYCKREICNYFRYYKKWFSEYNYTMLLKSSIFWRQLSHISRDMTMLSYYEDGEYYKEHEDMSKLTQLYYVFKEPKKFRGGQICFTDFNYSQEIDNNTLLLFPGWFKHEVKPVLLSEKTPGEVDKLECNGRYVFTTFYN